jgi:fused signal recognition particle receptor
VSEKKSWFQRLTGKKTDAEQKEATAPAAEPQEPADKAAAPEAMVEAAPVAEQAAEVAPPVPEPAPEPAHERLSEPEPVSEPEPITVQAPEPAPEAVPEPEKKSWFQRLKDGLKKSTSAISGGITDIFTKAKLDDDTLEELEDLLITSDLGVTVAGKLTAALATGRYDKEISGEEVKSVLAGEIEAILTPVARPLAVDAGHRPHIILMAGVNGAGKTTTIGKLARKFRNEGKSVMLAAGDTFRAAAVEQLQIWGDRNGVPVVTKEIGADAAALAYEAVERAEREGTDVLLIDTAGRLQNREELMAELAKVVRVIGKKVEGAPHRTVIVLDATTGQNAIHQVEVFQQLANISGIVMTKLDGSARGGVLVACADKFGLPVHAIGVGEAIEDLQPFDPREFARALVGMED